MNAEKLNVWLTLGANVGVLLGIIVLIFEVNQTNTMMQAQAAQARADSALNVAMARISAPGFAEVITAEDPETLSDADQYRLSQHNFLMWRQLENLHYQVRIGVLDERQARLRQVAWTVLQARPDGWWEQQRARMEYDPELRDFIEGVYQDMLARPASPQ